MMLDINGLEFIKKFEGYSPIPYRCEAGYLTIGYGHVIKKGEKYDKVNNEEATELLRQDVRIAENAVRRLITVQLNQYQFNALVSFTFNLGSGVLQSSTLRRKLNRGEYDIAANELLRWIYARGKVSKGLVRRRTAENQLFLKESE